MAARKARLDRIERIKNMKEHYLYENKKRYLDFDIYTHIHLDKSKYKSYVSDAITYLYK